MSHYMTALAMKKRGLAPATKILLYWLADHHNAETGKCFPSINRLVKLCEMSKRSVQNHLDALEFIGLIEVEKAHRDNGQQTANNYILNLSDEGVQNLHGEGADIARGRVQNLHPNNLVRNNLGSINQELFAQFYSAYPQKKGKGAAEKAWEKAIKIKEPKELVQAARVFAQFCEGKDKKFIPYPATWLNQKRWEDELEPEQRPATSTDLLNSLMSQENSCQTVKVIRPFDSYLGKE